MKKLVLSLSNKRIKIYETSNDCGIAFNTKKIEITFDLGLLGTLPPTKENILDKCIINGNFKEFPDDVVTSKWLGTSIQISIIDVIKTIFSDHGTFVMSDCNPTNIIISRLLIFKFWGTKSAFIMPWEHLDFASELNHRFDRRAKYHLFPKYVEFVKLAKDVIDTTGFYDDIEIDGLELTEDGKKLFDTIFYHDGILNEISGIGGYTINDIENNPLIMARTYILFLEFFSMKYLNKRISINTDELDINRFNMFMLGVLNGELIYAFMNGKMERKVLVGEENE